MAAPTPRERALTAWMNGRERMVDRAALSAPLAAEDSERGLRVLDRAEQLAAEILARSGGRGVTEEDIDDALATARER